MASWKAQSGIRHSDRMIRFMARMGDRMADAYVYRLWDYCAESHPDGRIKEPGAAGEIAMAIRFDGPFDVLLAALLESDFLEEDGAGYMLRDCAPSQVATPYRLEAESFAGKEHVYFIQQGEMGFVKIGYSKNPAHRIMILQTAHGERLSMRACAPGGKEQERALHARFASLRVVGEWFRPGDELLAYIQTVAGKGAL